VIENRRQSLHGHKLNNLSTNHILQYCIVCYDHAIKEAILGNVTKAFLILNKRTDKNFFAELRNNFLKFL
jgi:hypothetical protein